MNRSEILYSGDIVLPRHKTQIDLNNIGQINHVRSNVFYVNYLLHLNNLDTLGLTLEFVNSRRKFYPQN